MITKIHAQPTVILAIATAVGARAAACARSNPGLQVRHG
jgi:hypothetical protein